MPRHHHLNVDFSDTTGYGSSDHTSFTTKQVPVLFFFSGLHGDYHKPSDTWDKIDAPATAKVVGRRNAFFLCLLLDRGDRVAAGEPAVEIDVGAALRAERPKPLGCRLAADRAVSRAGNRVGHAGNIGIADTEWKMTPPDRAPRDRPPLPGR